MNKKLKINISVNKSIHLVFFSINLSLGLCSLCQNDSANLHGRCFQCQENYCQICYGYHAHFHSDHHI